MLWARLPPMVLVVVGLLLTQEFAMAWLDTRGTAGAAWWSYPFLLLMSIALLALAAAVTIDPRPLALRRALAGAALAWLVMGGYILFLGVLEGRAVADLWIPFLQTLAFAFGLIGLAWTTSDVVDDPDEPLTRLGWVVGFGVALIVAVGALLILASFARSTWRTIAERAPLDGLPWALVVLVIVIPLVTFGVASAGSRLASGGTFYAQAASNRRNSVLLLVSLVGIVAATTEIVAISLTFDPIPGLWAAAVAVVVGIGAAVAADRFGSRIILDTAGARPADPKRHAVLLDVVRELAIAANIPAPTTYVIEDGSLNAFATGRDARHASVAVTKGLLQAMDREQLQGVIGHELGHIRNLDIRYALYIAVMVGLVALVTDGFLRLIVEGWKNGAFFWKGRGKGALGAFVTGLLVGLFLLIVASLLRLLAPLFSALVQASSSREREFLADATSVEFTRNAAGLERALVSLAHDTDTLEAANRGTQHLWFRNPVKPGSDRRAGLLSTHPSLGARIDRLRVLQGLAPRHADGTSDPASET